MRLMHFPRDHQLATIHLGQHLSAGFAMRLVRILKALPRYSKAFAFPGENEKDAISLLKHLARRLAPRYYLPSYALDWLDDDSWRAHQRRFSVSSATLNRHYTLISLTRLVSHLEGDTAECGVYRGASTSLILAANARDAPERVHHMFDSFEGLGTPGTADGDFWSSGDLGASMDLVERKLGPGKYELYSGWIPSRFVEVSNNTFCFVHVDVDLYQPTIEALRFFWPRLATGGVLVCDDYGSSRCPGATRACDEFASEQGKSGFVGLPVGGGFMIRSQAGSIQS